MIFIDLFLNEWNVLIKISIYFGYESLSIKKTTTVECDDQNHKISGIVQGLGFEPRDH